MDHQRGCWMWAKRKPHWMKSWEEAAFAEDASGGIEGCVWPPRCYTCSFCRREFRSAQALGGHMNVHRRDRARLKQSTNEEDTAHVSRVSSLPIPKVKIGGSSTLCFITPNVDDKIDKGIKVPSDREEKKSVIAHDVVPSCKRIKIDGNPSCTIPQMEAMTHYSSPGEDLDLELRLGEAPKT